MREFIGQLGFTKGVENILAACYYAEFVENLSNFGIAEIEELLEAAKVPRPGNIPRDLKSLASTSKKYLNIVKGTTGSNIRYTLTTVGANVINERMQVRGLAVLRTVERAETLKEISESLHALIEQIPDKAEREYIEEAISCLSPMNNASRAAVIMGWTGTVYNLRRKIDKLGASGYATFTSHLQKINPKKFAGTFNDLEDVNDANLLDICEKMDIIKGKSVKDQLAQWLTFRNGVGHPTNVKPGINKVKAFFEDIIQYVLAES
ncbi:MAG TPA: hypothetical protein VGX24_17675 [Pyrinomonadaceae bacterium]|nr:hypothetical protein [Pyrinomonadaceae bacterium]